MKKSLTAVCCVGLLFAGCKEKAPNINFGTALVIDTTYVVSPVPAAEAHNVYIEEFTGAACTNCPAAHEQLHVQDSTYPGRINIAGLYIYNFVQTTPPTGSVHDFRDSAATQIGASVYLGISQLPNGGIDRIHVGGNIQVSTSDWNSTIAAQLAVTTPINLKVTSGYNATTGDDTITATITYTQTVATPHNLSVVITEDSIVDIQEFPLGVVEDHYVFTNVFRGMVSFPPFGDPVLPTMTSKEAGRVYKHVYIYHVGTGMNPAHSKIIAYVSNTTDYHVIQSCQTKMKP